MPTDTAHSMLPSDRAVWLRADRKWQGISSLLARRSDAYAALATAAADLLGSHGTLLARSLKACLNEHKTQIDLSNTGPELVSAILKGEARVGVTTLRIFGDSGTSATEWLPDLDESRRRAFKEESSYRSLVHTREIVRGVRGVTVSSGTFLMNPAVAWDNREPLPPFFPTLRNQDGAFAAVLRMSCPHLFIGYLSGLVEHDPPPRAAVTNRTACGPRMSECLIMAASQACSVLADGMPPARRVRGIGIHLQGIGALDAADFENWLRRLVVTYISSRLQQYERAHRRIRMLSHIGVRM